MNRHHPYGYDNPARRGGSPSGPGPDRYARFDRGGGPSRGRGGGRGRGNYSSHDKNMNYGNYDSGPPQGDMSGYNNYEDGYYNGPPYQGAYNQGNFEDGYGPNSQNDEDGYGRGARRPGRKDRDDKVHDSIIEERIQRERPCRILFIRNIKYETNSADVRRQFEEFGDIKTFFDLISTRGMVFVTYYDLRSAERARERMQGAEISGRPIDVHYSLPRDDHGGKGNDDKNNQLQGTLQVTLRNSLSGQPVDDNEVRRKFQQFGDVKSVRPVNERQDTRYVEFYDTRACDEAFDRLRHQGLQDGVMDIVFAWDNTDSGTPRHHDRDDDGYRGGRGGGSRGRGGGGGRGRGRGRAYDDDFERRNNQGDYARGGRGGRYDDDSGSRGPSRGGSFTERYDNPSKSGYHDNSGYGGSGGYSYNGPAVPNYAQSPVATGPPGDDRMEQARKVQQLLAALKQPQTDTPPPPIPPPTAALPGVPSIPPVSNPYYPPPSAPVLPPYPATIPVNSGNPYGPPSHAPPIPPVAGLAGLPPNILALMQAAGTQQHPQAQGQIPPVSQYGSPSAQNVASTGSYEQLMSYLQPPKPA